VNFSIAISGNLRDYMAAKLAIAEGGMMKAAGLASRVAVMRLRADVLSAGLGQKNANAWRANVYPRTDRSLRPAVYIFSKAPRIISAFNADTTITPKGKKVLAVPIGPIARAGRGGNTRRLKPEQVLARYPKGSVQWIPLKGEQAGGFLVVARTDRKTAGRGWKKRGGRVAANDKSKVSVPLYLMLKVVRLQKRLNVDAITRQLGDDWADIVAKSLAEALRNDDTGGALAA
jgi:hypothetical protein